MKSLTRAAIAIALTTLMACSDTPVPATDVDTAEAHDTDAAVDTVSPETSPFDVGETDAIPSDPDTFESDAGDNDTALPDAGPDVSEADASDAVATPDTVATTDTVAATDTVAIPDTEDSLDAAADAMVADTMPPAPMADMFDDLVGQTGAALRTELAARITGQTNLGYSGDGIARELMFAVIDPVGGRLECIYTGYTVQAEDPDALPLGTNMFVPEIDTTPNIDCRDAAGDPVSGGCFFNTEHSWPKSEGASTGAPEADLHHLFPTEEMSNNQRSSHPFGMNACSGNQCDWNNGGSELGLDSNGDDVFEVRPAFRGDVARAHFYFAVRYDKMIFPGEEAVLRAWHVEDPVSDKERDRNDAIAVHQGNRNPFIDRPEFVDAISDF